MFGRSIKFVYVLFRADVEQDSKKIYSVTRTLELIIE